MGKKDNKGKKQDIVARICSHDVIIIPTVYY